MLTIILMRALLAVLMTSNWWSFQWTSHPQNRGILIVYDCGADAQHSPFHAVNWFDIGSMASDAQFRRLPTPIGQFCQVVFEVRRGADGDLSIDEDMQTAESASMTMVED